MNRELQAIRISKALKKQGIEPDLVDLEAEIDDTLTLPENYRIIQENYGLLATKKDYEPETRSITKTGNYIEAKEKYERLPEKLRIKDNRYRAAKTIQMNELNNNNYKLWLKNRNRVDIEGIDADQYSKIKAVKVKKHKRKTLKTKSYVRRHRRRKPRK